jgi:sulfatase modifying factor 1
MLIPSTCEGFLRLSTLAVMESRLLILGVLALSGCWPSESDPLAVPVTDTLDSEMADAFIDADDEEITILVCDTDCSDSNVCTIDTCQAGACIHTPVADQTACDDGNPCTTNDACLSAACQGTAKECEGPEVCVDGTCTNEKCESVPKDMALIPAGSFLMGCPDPTWYECADAKPQHDVMLDAFYMDVYEVTVVKYKACVDAAACTAPASTHKFANWGKAGREQHPMNYVTWHQADAYCKWACSRLPTEAEWEKGARGGLVNQTYPWGDATPDCGGTQKLSCAISPASAVFWDNFAAGCGTDATFPVGTGSCANGYGLFDMAGNILEWVADWYAEDYYEWSPLKNPTGPASGTERVQRGSMFNFPPEFLTVHERFHWTPDDKNMGLRCARSATTAP